jgi:hypothetical protein
VLLIVVAPLCVELTDRFNVDTNVPGLLKLTIAGGFKIAL